VAHPADLVIRRCTRADVPAIESIINEAARAYRGVIPADCWHEPYMTRAALEAEIAAGVDFWGAENATGIIAVMGLQQVRDVSLIRHAYVRAALQRRGVGSILMDSLIPSAKGSLLVGTWAAAHWAIDFYRRHGFHLVSEAEKDRLLQEYWSIPARQRETSVVLVHRSGPSSSP
jgi:N-acetylglutamate synthase-like GNAT family acetyltransferase